MRRGLNTGGRSTVPRGAALNARSPGIYGPRAPFIRVGRRELPAPAASAATTPGPAAARATATIAPATGTALGLGSCFVDHEIAVTEEAPVQHFDCF